MLLMQRQLKAPKTTLTKAPEAPKTEEREFGDIIEKMVAQMAQRWRNQVLGAMTRAEENKFADANYARNLLGLASRVKRKLLKQFTNDRLERLSSRITSKVDNRNKAELYRRVENTIGISRKELEASEGLTYQINALTLETAQWVKKLRDETLEQWTANTLRMMAEGQSLEQIMSQFDDMVEKRKNHGKMVARTQIASFNSLTTKARAQNLGIEKAVWVTSKDERVRESHKARDGEEFELGVGLYNSRDGKTLLPGIDYNCRCDYRLIIPGLEDDE